MKKVVRTPSQRAIKADPYLIIIMRNDMASMNAGKACAQASHASNHMVKVVSESTNEYLKDLLSVWQKQTTQGFGKVIVLAASWSQMEEYFKNNFNIADAIQTGVLVDPTYPIKDGSVTHAISIPTCMWAFGGSEDLKKIYQHFDYMP